jgi:preprotein translocase subunit SecB
MAEQKPDGLDTNRIMVALQRVYLKDTSFEAPNSPQIFSGEWRPNVSLNLGSKTTELGDDQYECVLNLAVEARQEDKVAFLVEIQQAGVFLLRGLEPADLQRALVTFCPQQLYPFAREAVSDFTSKGGFPALQLQPMNFEAIAAEAYRRQQAEQAAAGNDAGASSEASH